MKIYEALLLQNKAWVQEKLSDDPLFFKRMAQGQQPRFLWIGCSDSRVPADEVTGTDPGELFVHRNIANLVVPTDINLLSVLQYAVEVLEVKHIIVCGHYGCGGVNAALANKRLGIIDEWLQGIKDVYKANKVEVDALSTEEERSRRMVELNVIAQVKHLADTSIVKNAWEKHQYPVIHGWVYGLDNGLIKPIYEMHAPSAD